MFTASSCPSYEWVHATFSLALPTSHCAYKKPVFYTNTWQSASLFCSCISPCEAGPLLYLKLRSQSVTFCFRWGLGQFAGFLYQCTGELFWIYLSGWSMFEQSSIQQFCHTTEQEPLSLLLLQVWLHSKHFCMILEQRRFYQLLHWQTFSYREKATCSIVASHCMTKHDVLTDASTHICLDYFYVSDFGCRLCTCREQNFAVFRLNVK